MLQIDDKNVNYYARSMNGESQIARFNANRNNNRMSVSIDIEDRTLYLNNLETFENDFTAFMADVSSIDD